MRGDKLSGLLQPGGDGVAVIDSNERLTRGDLFERAARLGRELDERVGPDERIGLVDTRDVQTIVVVLACLLAGRPIAMLGVAEYGEEAKTLAARARCRIVFCGDINHDLDADPGAVESSPRYGLTESDSPEAVVLFTSGTTGMPKGVRLSRANIAANLTAMLRITEPWTSQDRLGQVLTVTHSFGLSMALMAVARRVPIVRLPDGPPSRALSQLMADHSISVFACVPYFLRLMSRRGMSLGGTAAPDLRALFLAGGGLGDEEIAQILPDFGGSLYLMYGFTETTARAAVRRHGDGAPSGSVGLPLPGTHIDIVSPRGEAVAVGEEGLLRAIGPSLMIGYLGEVPRVKGTPFLTSDLGRVDSAGNVFITGRDVEMMNFRGNRVSVVRVEAQAMRADGVIDARAIPDSRDEDAQCTLRLVLSDTADSSHVRRDVISLVEPRGIVRAIEFVADLPKTRSGKAIRY
ncbi:class I adenylate-forming enzyme family protein [Microbacterium lacticum]